MRQIIAHGGAGFASSKRDLKIERYLLKQVQNPEPKICFLPQASAEAKDYVVSFFQTFCELGAKPSWISLFGRVENTWQQQLLSQDIIYVGGGNTRSMLTLWREWGVDKVLLEAYQKGILLCGISAGAICWFEQAVTDSVWPLGALDGLKLLKGSCCPHYDSEVERRPAFQEKINNRELIPGLALEDQTAAHFIDEKLTRIVTANPGKRAFHVAPNEEKALDTTIIND